MRSSSSPSSIRSPANGGANDLEFLKLIYNAGGSAFFDIVAARVDGGARTPYDRSVRPDEAALSRVILIREVTAAAGDPAKPIWATHYGWDAGRIAGNLTETTQADYVVAGLERARAEWPWMGPLFQWGLIPGADLGGGTPAERALLREDGSPTPLFTELGAFAARGGASAAPTGLAPVGRPSTSGRATGTSSISAPTRTAPRPKSRRDSASDSRGRGSSPGRA